MAPTLTPIRAAASAFSATARMALPSRVFSTMTNSAATTASAAATMTSWVAPTWIGPSAIELSVRTLTGKRRTSAPNQIVIRLLNSSTPPSETTSELSSGAFAARSGLSIAVSRSRPTTPATRVPPIPASQIGTPRVLTARRAAKAPHTK